MTDDTKVWLASMWAAFISGGASAVTAAFAVTQITPESYNMRGGLSNMLYLIVTTFAVAGAIGVFHKLSTSPIPPKWLRETVSVTRVVENVDSPTAGLPDKKL